MRLKKLHWIGIIFGLLILIADFFIFRDKVNLFFFLVGIAMTVGSIPFVVDLMLENKKDQEVAEMFLEFTRNLSESVATGTPISKSIVNIKQKSYGQLSPYVQKLANQIELGIPVHIALENFSYDVANPVISRAIALIMEAERAGGEIDYILESVAKSISEVEKLKKERKAAIYSLVVQGYIIFFIFIGIMLVMQFKILPLTQGIGGFSLLTTDITTIADYDPQASTDGLNPADLSRQFLYLLVTQGLFAGIIIGKLAEGTIRAGIKHSFVLAVTALLVSSGSTIFLQKP